MNTTARVIITVIIVVLNTTVVSGGVFFSHRKIGLVLRSSLDRGLLGSRELGLELRYCGLGCQKLVDDRGLVFGAGNATEHLGCRIRRIRIAGRGIAATVSEVLLYRGNPTVHYT